MDDKRKAPERRKELEVGESSHPKETVEASSSDVVSLRRELRELKANSEAFQEETRGKFETMISLL